jgi:hypothetical protein
VVFTDEDSTAAINLAALLGASDAADLDWIGHGVCGSGDPAAAACASVPIPLLPRIMPPAAMTRSMPAIAPTGPRLRMPMARALMPCPAFTVLARDQQGGLSDNPLVVPVAVTPVLDATLSLPANGFYAAGDTLTFELRLDQPLTLNSAGGVPSLDLVLANDRVGRALLQSPAESYAAGAALSFSYVIQAGDLGSGAGACLVVPAGLTIPSGSYLFTSDTSRSLGSDLGLAQSVAARGS